MDAEMERIDRINKENQKYIRKRKESEASESQTRMSREELIKRAKKELEKRKKEEQSKPKDKLRPETWSWPQLMAISDGTKELTESDSES